MPSYRDRVDELLTVYLSLETDDLVGCQIKSIGRIMKRLRNLRILIKDKDVELRVLFFSLSCFSRRPRSAKNIREAIGCS